ELNAQLRGWRAWDGRGYLSQTFQLGQAGDLYVRANIWHPRGQEPPTARVAGEMSLYGLPHDHAFSFLTVGYWGPGYRTAIYEYDRQRVVGRIGEAVDLTFLEETTLPIGKVMYYRACPDVHDPASPPQL